MSLRAAPITALLGSLLSLASAGCVGEFASSVVSEPMPFDGSSSSTSAGLTDGTGTEATTGDDASSTTEALTSSGASWGTTAESSTTAPGSTTTGVDASPPELLDFNFSPPSLLASGPINLEVLAEGADGVRLTFGEQFYELAPEGDDGTFVGQVKIYTGADNGDYVVTITPWRGEDEEKEEGDPEATTYTVALPSQGSELFWEAGNLIGPGIAVAIDLLPSGDLLEFGTRYDNGAEPRCYVRRRDPGGAWGGDDYLQVLPGVRCEATDLAVDEDGGIHVLARRGGKGEEVWWLGSIATWGAPPETRGLGLKDEQANDLAVRGDTLVLCGATPSGFGDLDVMLRTYRPKQPAEPRVLDYLPPGWAWDHSFSETSRGCAFRDDTSVVVVGDAFGQHDKQLKSPTTRRFSLVYDPQSNSVDENPFAVHEPEIGQPAQSFARAVVIGDWGDAIITGYSCLKECSKGTYEGMLWSETEWGGLMNEISLGYVPLENYTPSAIAWHPAHYAIVASGGPGDEFLLRAYRPSWDQVLWSFPKASLGALQIARTITIGRFGQVYSGGVGASYYPAIAYVGG